MTLALALAAVLVVAQAAAAPPVPAPAVPAPTAPSAGRAPDLVLDAAPVAGTAALHPKRIAVMKTDLGGDVDAALAPQITSKLAEEVRAQTHAEVISSDEIVALLKHEKERAILGECKEQESCLAEIANALGAEIVVSAKVSRLAGDKAGASAGWALAVSAVDAQTASVVGRVNESWGGDAVTLLQLVRPVVTKLFATTSIPKGAIDVVGAVSGSKILVDDEVRGSAELPHVADLLVGGHHVVVQSSDKKPVDKWVIVEADKTASLAVSQESLDEPLTSSWWFWSAAGAGVMVTGAAVAGAYFAFAGTGKTGVAVQLNADKAFGGPR